MKRNNLNVAFGVALLTAALSCFYSGCANQQNPNGNVVVTATPEPTPDNAAITAELTRMENDWARIIKERDGATVRRIEADDVIILYPDGSLGTKEDDAKDIESGAMIFDSWETSDVKVNVLSKDFAVATLRYNVKNAKVKTADGKSMDISGQYLSVDTFARRNGQWLFVALSSVKVQSPVASPAPSAAPKASASPRVSQPAATPKPSPARKPSPVARPSARPTPVRTPATANPTP